MKCSLNRSLALAIAATVLAGCASSYDLTLMPRSSGKLYYGEAVESSVNGPASVSIQIEDKIYTGNWVVVAPAHTTGYVTGGLGWGWRRGGIGLGTSTVTVDNPNGGEAKALLQAPDGTGLRCDFRGIGSGRGGGGTCQDDKGLIYDVQIRLKESK